MPTPPDDILINKAAVIERCLRRVLEEARACPHYDNFTHIDAMTLNIERACQAAIDMAMHVVAERRLGVPQSSAGAFSLLERAGLIPSDLSKSLRAMSGFRNIAVHQYEELDLDVLRWVVESGLQDFVKLGEALGVKITI